MRAVNAEIEDLEEILILQKLCYLENAERYNDPLIPPLIQTVEDLRREAARGIVLKTSDSGKIIGSIRGYEHEGTCFIGRVIVHPEYRNMGIGKMMMSEIEKRFTDVKRFELFTGYRDVKNIHFYSSQGYVIFKEESHGENVRFVYFEKKRAV